MTHQIRYSLHTERFPNLLDLVSRYFSGARLTDDVGLWLGETELSATIEIVGDDDESTRRLVLYLARDIRAENHQTAVLVTETVIRAALVTASELS